MAIQSEYDIIFAGGGPCACIVASRLIAANPDTRILIIECGEHTLEVAQHVQPARFMSMLRGPTSTVFYRHVGKPSDSLEGRSPIVPSGRAMGGGSSVNWMAYTRASASDYDDWETIHGNKGWGSDYLIPLLRKAETYQDKGISELHGSRGPIKVSFASDLNQVGKDFLDAASRYDNARELTEDVNAFYECNKYGKWARYIDKDSGRRSDVPHHYIYNKPGNSNLTILTKSLVDTIIIEDGQAVGVRYYSLENPEAGVTFKCASKLVVLGAGAFGSPAILERSGIGSAKVLQPLGVPQIVDLPGVGENYMGMVILGFKVSANFNLFYEIVDHVTSFSAYLGPPELENMDEIFYGDEDRIKHHESVWSETGKGLMAHNGLDAMIKMRPDETDLQAMSPHLDEYWNQYFERSPDKPLVVLFTTAFSMTAKGAYALFSFLAYPAATGHTHIVSKEGLTLERDFHPGFLDHPADVAATRWIYKKSRELARRMDCYRGEDPLSHPAFDPSSPAAVALADTPKGCDDPEIVYSKEDDERIDEHMRKTVSTTGHSCGTCAMKPREQGGVVDDRLNVYGIRGLKVADCSIFPANVGANTYNTAIGIGEKAAILIAEDLGLKL
ncbi:alcohol oxidase-like protein [Panaeolus papilionaceus]|nr:alcohol oxidase-like protein [Panaeolus papilionaceus]